MKKFAALLFLCLAVTAHAEIKGAPFSPESDARFNRLEENKIIAAPAANGHHMKQVAQATYDFSVYGGSSTVSSGLIDLGVGLPANALIVRSYLYVLTQPTTSNSGTLAFQCGTANNVKTATAAASYPSSGPLEGASTGASTVFQNISSACNLKAQISTGSLTAGKVTAFVEYVTHP